MTRKKEHPVPDPLSLAGGLVTVEPHADGSAQFVITGSLDPAFGPEDVVALSDWLDDLQLAAATPDKEDDGA